VDSGIRLVINELASLLALDPGDPLNSPALSRLAPMIHERVVATAIGSGRGDSVSYWACARLEPHKERVALHCLGLAGYVTYLPRLRERRLCHGRRIETRLPLFPGYCFFGVEAQWHTARWSVGVIGLIMDGLRPARVPDAVISEIRARERNGAVELPRRDGFKAGDRVRVLAGPFEGCLGLYAEMRPHERVLVLLALLGGQQRVELPKDSIGRASLSGSPRHRTISVAPSVTIRPLMLIPAQRVSQI
jgi:transcriptional antiterminator RfaH